MIFRYYWEDISDSLIACTMLHFLKVYGFFADTFNKFPSSLSGSEFILSGKAVGVILKAFFKIHPLFFLPLFLSSSFFHKHCIYYSTAGAIHYGVMVLGPLRPSSMALQLVLILAGESQDHRSSPPLLQMCLDQGKLTKRFVSFKTLMWLCHIFSADSHRYWSLCGVPYSMVSIRPVSWEIFLFAKSGS